MSRFNIPPLTRTLLLSLLALTLLNTLLLPYTALSLFTRIGHGHPLLCIVPHSSYYYPWTLITATFVEQNIFGLIVTGCTVLFGGRYLERAWGLNEFAKFVLIMCVVPNALTWGTYLLLYGASGSSRALQTTISGGISLQSSLLVSFKQLVPEHTLSLLHILRIRVKHFPSLFLLSNTLSALLLGTETAMFLSWYSFLTSWVYLRFYRVSPLITTTSTAEFPTIRGDASDTFSFASFFPEPLHTPISKIADQIWGVLIQLRICTPFSADDIDAGNEQAQARAEGSGLPTMTRGSGRREEAERRRAIALKALEQRLHVPRGSSPASGAGPSSVPSQTPMLTVPAPTAKE